MSAARELRLRYERQLASKITETFEEAGRDIERKMFDFNRRRNIKDDIQLRKMKNGEISVEDYNRWRAGQIFQGKQWVAKREQIQNTLYNANSIATKMANEQRVNLFKFNANYQAYELEHKAGLNFGFGLYDSATVSRLIASDPQILPMWKVDEPKDYIWNGKIVNNAIRQGIIQGERLDQIAKRLYDGLVTQNKNKMLTFARTGMTQAQNAGREIRLREAEKMGIKVHKEWMATFDERTRWQHADLDGQKKPMDKPFEVGGYKIMYPGDPSAHPSMVYNCRCTMVGDLDDYPSSYERYDNIDGKPVKEMTYREWEKAKGVTSSKPQVPSFDQVGIGLCKTVDDVNNLLNSNGLWRTNRAGITSEADLTGCDLDSAKSIAAAYEQVFAKYPQLKGRLDAPDAQPRGMSSDTFAWCYLRNGGKVEVNPDFYNNWGKVTRAYERCVISGFHPKGTTAESIVTHEIGHAIDGLLAREGVKGGVTASGEYRYASSSMRSTIMKRAAKKDSRIAEYFDVWGNKDGMDYAINDCVSEYATKNPQEWFAECFAEYITSANPRTVAEEFGKELEMLVAKLN